MDLTEKEVEYAVSCRYHVFAHHLVIEYIVNNTVQEQVLDNVRVEVQPISDNMDEVWELESTVPAERVKASTRPSPCFGQA